MGLDDLALKKVLEDFSGPVLLSHHAESLREEMVDYLKFVPSLNSKNNRRLTSWSKNRIVSGSKVSFPYLNFSPTFLLRISHL